MEKSIQLLKIINRDGYITQRKIAQLANISLGSVNGKIKQLIDENLLIREMKNNENKYGITSKGKKILDNHYIKTAVILAAGLGSRLHPVTKDEKPKGFIEVEGRSLIERSIENLLKNYIDRIIIVTGHLSNFYDDLKSKYSCIETVKNEQYAITGSMASLSKAYDLIHEEKFLLLESDLIYENKAIEVLQDSIQKDCVLLSGKTNSGDEVYVEVRENSIYKLSKDKHSLNNIYGELVGICKISHKLLDHMMKQYNNNTNSEYHYEYAIEDTTKNYKVGYKKIENLVWGEIDDARHLQRVERYIIPNLKI
ncbi:nucleotidyl transferase [Clostridiaceae bacterium 14S0207]|nr:nucleotidyl transferase [Clostridiaceae bacterium 14S0207]